MSEKIYPIVKQKLDAIGPGMCLAKWKQVTIHLPTGHTHSCHHPITHKIPVEEVVIDASALHNTNYKKSLRKEMMTGERPSECQYCWNVEDNAKDPNVFSDRVHKSFEPWARNYQEEVLDAGWTKNIAPSYLEVSFSYGCNFKCSYCSPEISSKWMEEIQQHGPFPTSRHYNNLGHFARQNKMPIPEREENPYVDAFWKWWPDIYSTLHTFRITGGEPLMTKHTFRVLDYIIANPNKNLELGINSNLCVPDKLFNEFVAKLKIAVTCVKSITVYTSCEAHGAKAEYIRHGLNYSKWLASCHVLLSKLPNVHLSIMSTYNALSVTSYDQFLDDVVELKVLYKNTQRNVRIDIPYLRNPEFLTMGILTKDFLVYAGESVKYMQAKEQFFDPKEISMMQRVHSLFESLMSTPMSNLTDWQGDFVRFVIEHDKRRGTNFLATFPEMKPFYNGILTS